MNRLLLSAIFAHGALLLGATGCSSKESESGNTAGASASSGGNTTVGMAGSSGSGGSAMGAAGSGGAQGGNAGNTAGGAPAGGGGMSTAVMGGAGAGGAGNGGMNVGGMSNDAGAIDLPPFSFFMTSIEAIRMLSGSEFGFGGDLRFGQADGLSGADEICRQTAEMGMEGAGQKEWRAFLSVTNGPGGGPVHAADRIGEGPWYDRLGRLVAMNLEDLINPRPVGAHELIVDDLPNEHGIPNGYPVPGGPRVDNHHTLTGSNEQGMLNGNDMADTCNDWTSSDGNLGQPRCGVAWPRNDGDSWISFLDEGGCAPGYNLVESAPPPDGYEQAVGANGGYGAIYCFSLTP